MSLYIRERIPADITKLTAIADQYIEAHGSWYARDKSSCSRHMGRNSSNIRGQSADNPSNMRGKSSEQSRDAKGGREFKNNQSQNQTCFKG